jgi:ferric-dicitrate binding protein FerR (iron transport regulator)
MKLKNWKGTTLALLLIAALLNLASNASLAALTERAAKASGELTALGIVKVDGVQMMSGATIIPGSLIRTEEKSGAIISLGQLGRLELSPMTSLRLDFDEAGFVGQLERGRLRVSLPEKASASIFTRNATVVAHHERATLFTIEVKDGAVRVAAQTGRVELREGESTQRIFAGQEAMAGMAVNSLSPPTGATQNSQKSNNGKLTGLVLAISTVVTAIVLIVALTRSDVPHEDLGGGFLCCISPER